MQRMIGKSGGGLHQRNIRDIRREQVRFFEKLKRLALDRQRIQKTTKAF